MNDIGTLGRLLVGIGLLIVLVGGLLIVFGRIPFLGRLPGDIRVQRGNFTCFMPIATSILLSLLLTLLLNLFLRWPRR
jgi:hypothetical protein